MIRRERWQFFCTLTFRDHLCDVYGSENKRSVNMLLSKFLCTISETLKMPATEWFWVLRVEKGGMTDRTHWHLILGGLPNTHVNKTTAHVLKFLWSDKNRLNLGIAKVNVYNNARDGVSYMVKGLQTDSPRSYEVGKFAETAYTALFPAPSLLAKWARSVEPNRRRRRARDMKKSFHVKLSQSGF